MALNYDKLEKVWPKLSKEMRVAIACVAVERIRDLYELGNFKLTLGDMVISVAQQPPGKDLIELGLEMGWGFVAGTPPDKATRDAIEKWIKAKILHKSAAKTVSAAARSACKAVYHVLHATDDDTGASVEQAMTLAEVGPAITLRNMGIGNDDNDIPTQIAKKEQAWQMRVVEHALDSAKLKPRRELFAELLAEEPAFQPYLEQYKKKYGKKK